MDSTVSRFTMTVVFEDGYGMQHTVEQPVDDTHEIPVDMFLEAADVLGVNTSELRLISKSLEANF